MVQNIFSEVLIDFGKEVCTPPRNLSIIDHKEKMATCTFYKNALHVSSKRLKNILRKTTSNKKF